MLSREFVFMDTRLYTLGWIDKHDTDDSDIINNNNGIDTENYAIVYC